MLLVCIGCMCGSACTHESGHTTIALYDSARSRTIDTEIYYPADIPGDDVPLAAGRFPTVVFGHGYLIAWSDYEFLWNGLVPHGFIVALPRTESGLLPDHLAFGKDLAFVSEYFNVLNADTGSLFYDHISGTSAIMGHSMGGGASFLAMEYAPSATALANFAAAETSTSAIAAAAFINVPALLFSGTEDCITPPVDHQIPMYDALASGCKTLVTIAGASHCQFAQNNAACVLGETLSGCPATIDRATQETLTLRFLLPWLEYTLKDNLVARDQFQTLLISGASDRTITYVQDCPIPDVGAGHPFPMIIILAVLTLFFSISTQVGLPV